MIVTGYCRSPRPAVTDEWPSSRRRPAGSPAVRSGTPIHRQATKRSYGLRIVWRDDSVSLGIRRRVHRCKGSP
eukprot:48825-Pyramimonas_sp.AAC.4